VFTSIVDTFNGLPLHVLVVHAAVILTPAAALLALALVRPSWRMRLRWPAAIAVLLAWLLVWLARASGEALSTAIGAQLESAPDLAAAVVRHEETANQLNQVLFALLVVVVLFAWLLPKLPRAAGTVGAVAIAALAMLAIVLVAQTGDQGARAVWNTPDGAMNYDVE
jgi:hypothetical protein